MFVTNNSNKVGRDEQPLDFSSKQDFDAVDSDDRRMDHKPMFSTADWAAAAAAAAVAANNSESKSSSSVDGSKYENGSPPPPPLPPPPPPMPPSSLPSADFNGNSNGLAMAMAGLEPRLLATVQRNLAAANTGDLLRQFHQSMGRAAGGGCGQGSLLSGFAAAAAAAGIPLPPPMSTLPPMPPAVPIDDKEEQEEQEEEENTYEDEGVSPPTSPKQNGESTRNLCSAIQSNQFRKLLRSRCKGSSSSRLYTSCACAGNKIIQFFPPQSKF